MEDDSFKNWIFPLFCSGFLGFDGHMIGGKEESIMCAMLEYLFISMLINEYTCLLDLDVVFINFY